MHNLDMDTEQRSTKMIPAYSAQHATASAGLPRAASSQGGCGGRRGTVCWQRHKGGASHNSSSCCSLGHLRSHGTKGPGASRRCRRRFDAKWLQNTESNTSCQLMTRSAPYELRWDLKCFEAQQISTKPSRMHATAASIGPYQLLGSRLTQTEGD